MIYKDDIRVEAAPAQAWRCLIDLEDAPEYVPYLERAQMLDGPDLALGHRVHLWFDYIGHQFDAEAVVVDMIPEKTLALRGERASLGVVVNARWELVADSGGTRVQMSVSLTFHTMLAQLGARALIGDRVAREALASSLDRFRTRAESGVCA